MILRSTDPVPRPVMPVEVKMPAPVLVCDVVLMSSINSTSFPSSPSIVSSVSFSG